MNLLAVALIWGINMAVMKHAITEIDAFVFNVIRLVLSAATLGICVWLENRNALRRQGNSPKPQDLPASRHQWISILLFALMAGAIYQIIFVVGMDRTTAGNTALIMSSIPMWTAVLSFFILREKLGYAWAGISITFLGTLIVTLYKGGFSLEPQFLLGNSLVLISALAWSLGAVYSRPMLRYVTPIRLAFYATLFSLPVHLLVSAMFSGTNPIEKITSQVWICILYSGIFSTGLAYAMWNLGIKQLGASHAAIYQNLVPLVALIVAWKFLGETIAPVQLVGGGMIIAGLFIARRLRPKLEKLEKAEL